MAHFDVFKRLPNGRHKLYATINGSTDHVTLVTNAKPVTMRADVLRTSVAPPSICPRCHSTACHCGQAPTPQRLTTQTQAKAAVLAAMMADVPPPPSFDRVLERQRQLGLR